MYGPLSPMTILVYPVATCKLVLVSKRVWSLPLSRRGHILNCELTLFALLPTRASFLTCSFTSLTIWLSAE